MPTRTELPAAEQGLAVLTAGMGSFFLVQRYQGVSRVSGWLGRHRFGARALALLDVVADIEDRLIAFYTGQPGRFAAAITLVFVNWVLGAVEIACMLYFLGHPISLADAWVRSLPGMMTAGTLIEAICSGVTPITGWCAPASNNSHQRVILAM